jgi:chromosome segregation ATPase
MTRSKTPPLSKPKFLFVSLLANAALLAAIMPFVIYGLNVVEERGQLRSDVKNLTDALSESRTIANELRATNKGLTDSLRESQTHVAVIEALLDDTRKQTASANHAAEKSKAEAQIYKDLTEADKRCEPYKNAVAHMERQLAISDIDVFSLRGERRQEAIKKLENSKDSLDRCMGVRAPLSGL